jgi:thiamine-phosphate pyrophosphorylase
MADRRLLYYITDRSQFGGDEAARRSSLLDKISEATRAGVDYIQLRERDLTARELGMLATDALTFAGTSTTSIAAKGNPSKTADRELRTRLLINSRTDVALAVGADGVHLRTYDVTPEEVRQVLDVSPHWPSTPDKFLVAASCHTVADVFRAESEKADFAVFGPVFGKSSAPGTQATGFAGLREACHAKIPVLALGSVTLKNAAACLNAGAAGVAGIRLFQENKVEDIVRELRAL